MFTVSSKRIAGTSTGDSVTLNHFVHCVRTTRFKRTKKPTLRCRLFATFDLVIPYTRISVCTEADYIRRKFPRRFGSRFFVSGIHFGFHSKNN